MSSSSPTKQPETNMKLIDSLTAAFRGAANPTRAKGQEKYLRNQFACLGLASPERRALQAPVVKQHPINTEQQLIDTAHHLWGLNEREFAYAAMELFVSYKKLWTPTMLDAFRYCIVTNSWWDTVDFLASNCVGKLVSEFPQLGHNMELWIVDDHLWIRRVAILHQLKYKKDTNETRLFDFCEKSFGEQDFFIRKAIGWSLREYSKTSPNAVSAFVSKHSERMSSLSLREASKYLPKQ